MTRKPGRNPRAILRPSRQQVNAALSRCGLPEKEYLVSEFTLDAVEELFRQPLLALVYRAASLHREHHEPDSVQRSRLLSIKTGGCPENCGYCSQSAHFDTPVEGRSLLEVDDVIEAATRAREQGADRFCMGAAWREIPAGDPLDTVLEMVQRVKALGLETCATFGMVTDEQAQRLEEAGLDFYNHNLDTGRAFYGTVVTTRTYDERLETLAIVRKAGLRVCSGGIIGLGESIRDRAELLWQLASLDPPPESVPINTLVAVPGTPMAGLQPVDWTEVVRTVAVARIVMPAADVRLSAGRGELCEATQALAFLAGVNSIFMGEELLTTPNPELASDDALFVKLGLQPLVRSSSEPVVA